ncbi:Uncharacterized protein Adt_43511 [Abeliophyllum distichum]|uniref:Uncharacterized protein n=1 Tax=Abeliophyllum distichum TaxID=126358 RepID=A0ABD1PBS8_9LAMI
MAKNNGSIPDSFPSVKEAYDVVDDLSSWEFVDPSLSEDDEDLYSFTDEEDDDVIEDELTSKNGKEEEEVGSESPPDVISVESLSVSPPQLTLTVDVCYDDQEEEVDDEDDDDEDDEDGFGLDDELVPWMLKDRFGRQRIRKMGKRGGSRVNKSKRGPYFYNRPGCVWVLTKKISPIAIALLKGMLYMGVLNGGQQPMKGASVRRRPFRIPREMSGLLSTKSRNAKAMFKAMEAC